MGMIPISQTGRNHRFLKMTNLWKFSVQVGNQIGVAEYYLQSRLICPHRCLLSGCPPVFRCVLIRQLVLTVLYCVRTLFLWTVFRGGLAPSVTRSLRPTAMVYPAGQWTTRKVQAFRISLVMILVHTSNLHVLSIDVQVWNILSRKPGPVQRLQVQRRILGLALPMSTWRLQLDNSIAIADVEAFNRRI